MSQASSTGIEPQVRELKKAIRALEADPRAESADRQLMAGIRPILSYLRERDVYPEALPAEGESFVQLWRSIPPDMFRRNWYGFGEILLRRLIVEYRRTHDALLRETLAALLRPETGEARVTADSARALLLSAERPLPASGERRFRAAAAETDILDYRTNRDPALRKAIVTALRDAKVLKYVKKVYLWGFLCLDYCRRVDEAVFAGNRRDQIRTLRALTRFLIMMQKIKPPLEKQLVRAMRAQLARALLHADRPVAVGILEFLRDTQQMRSGQILRLLTNGNDRLAYVNFYYWATGKARPGEWYADKFQKHFQRKLQFAGEEKGFVLGE